MELTTSWKEEGRREGEAKVVLRQLRLRCGELAPEARARVSALPLEGLESLAEALLDFRSGADLECWLQDRWLMLKRFSLTQPRQGSRAGISPGVSSGWYPVPTR